MVSGESSDVHDGKIGDHRKQKNRPMSKEERTRRYEEGLASGELAFHDEVEPISIRSRKLLPGVLHAYDASRFGIRQPVSQERSCLEPARSASILRESL
jgi:hypothetical protein